MKNKTFNRIGIYSGSFNPIHVGHAFVINEALKLAIDKLYIVVSPQSPFKEKEDLISFDDRLEMVRLSIKDSGIPEDRVEVVDWERNEYPSYTIDLLQKVKEMFPEKEITLFMGLDNFLSIDLWKASDKLLSDHTIYVIPRDCADASDIINKKIAELKEWYHDNVKGVAYSNPYNNISISATEIRSIIESGQKIPQGLIAPSVEKYIVENKLYIPQEVSKTKNV